MASCGVRVFEDDGEGENAELPRGQQWGRPCVHGHGEREGRQARYSINRQCVQCATERTRKVPEAERKRKTDDSLGVARPFERTSVPCARGKDCRKKDRRGNPAKLTRIALAHGEPVCSRECAGYLTEFEAAREDVSDADLIKMLHSGEA